MSLFLQILVDNYLQPHGSQGLTGEHGFAALLKWRDHTILFDTGQGLALMGNMEKLGYSADDIDLCILSHGHYDHTGGLMPLLRQRRDELPVYLHSQAFRRRYSHDSDGLLREIGFQYDRHEYEKAGARFHLLERSQEIVPGLVALAEIRRPDGWKGDDERLVIKDGEGTIPDPFPDDLSLSVETEKGPVIISGCAHAGIASIMDDFVQSRNYEGIYALCGGMHLSRAGEEKVRCVENAIHDYHIEHICPAHCTGMERSFQFAARFPGRVRYAHTGAEFIF